MLFEVFYGIDLHLKLNLPHNSGLHAALMNSHPRASAVAGWAGLYFVAFVVFVLLFSPQPQSSFVPIFVTAWCGAALGIALVFLFSKFPSDTRSLLMMTASGMAMDLACNLPAAKIASHWPEGIMPAGSIDWPYAALVAVGNFGVLLAATGVGLVVARGMKQPNYLLMAAVAGALADIYSVFFGPSKHTLSSDVFFYLSFQWNVAGQGIIPCVGAGDFIFLSLFFAGARRFKLDDRVTLAAMLAAFALGFLTAVLTQQGIPALPFMAAMLLSVQGPALWRMTREAKSAALARAEGS